MTMPKKKKLSNKEWKKRRASKSVQIGTVSEKLPRVSLKRFDKVDHWSPRNSSGATPKYAVERDIDSVSREATYISPNLKYAAEQCAQQYRYGIVFELEDEIEISERPTGLPDVDNLLTDFTEQVVIVRMTPDGLVVFPWEPSRNIDDSYRGEYATEFAS